jgi:hypothetical protein
VPHGDPSTTCLGIAVEILRSAATAGGGPASDDLAVPRNSSAMPPIIASALRATRSRHVMLLAHALFTGSVAKAAMSSGDNVFVLHGTHPFCSMADIPASPVHCILERYSPSAKSAPSRHLRWFRDIPCTMIMTALSPQLTPTIFSARSAE